MFSATGESSVKGIQNPMEDEEVHVFILSGREDVADASESWCLLLLQWALKIVYYGLDGGLSLAHLSDELVFCVLKKVAQGPKSIHHVCLYAINV